MTQRKRVLTILLVLTLTLVLCITCAFGSTGTVSKDLSYNNIKIKLNDTLITPKDAAGKTVEPFIIEGTTYLPVRAVASALGLEVGWDGTTKTVLLNGTQSALSPTELFKQCSVSVVHIHTPFSGGTGFFIEEDIIVTNNHVIDGAWSATVTTVDGQEYNVVEVVARSSNPDLALLRIDGKGTPLTLNTQCADVGESIYSIGAPMGIFPTMSSGMITNNSYEENGVSFYLSNIGVLSGNSGGPIFDASGEVIGVVQGGISDGVNSMDMIINISHVLEMDRSNPSELGFDSTPDEDNYTLASLQDAQVGQLVSFGRYEQDADPSTAEEEILWIVVERNGSDLKLMSLYCLDVVPFMSDNSPVSWDNSYAREFLNNEFYNKAFSAAEQAMIRTTTVKNDPNPIHGTSSGSDTEDKVYLPSLDEAMAFYHITTYEERFYDGVYAQATQHAIEKGVWLEVAGSTNCWWWLRSSGGSSTNAAEVGSAGYLSFNGSNAAETQRAVRPVINITLDQ